MSLVTCSQWRRPERARTWWYSRPRSLQGIHCMYGSSLAPAATGKLWCCSRVLNQQHWHDDTYNTIARNATVTCAVVNTSSDLWTQWLVSLTWSSWLGCQAASVCLNDLVCCVQALCQKNGIQYSSQGDTSHDQIVLQHVVACFKDAGRKLQNNLDSARITWIQLHGIHLLSSTVSQH